MRKRWTEEDIERMVCQLDADYCVDVYDNARIFINPRLRRSLGRVTYKIINGELEIKTFEIAQRLINYGSDEQIIDTILHEFAHCLQIIYDNECNHGESFKKYCLELGCVPSASSKEPLAYIHEEREQKNKEPKRSLPYKYVVSCECCDWKYRYKTKSKVIKFLESVETNTRYFCPKCESYRIVTNNC